RNGQHVESLAQYFAALSLQAWVRDVPPPSVVPPSPPSIGAPSTVESSPPSDGEEPFAPPLAHAAANVASPTAEAKPASTRKERCTRSWRLPRNRRLVAFSARSPSSRTDG